MDKATADAIRKLGLKTAGQLLGESSISDRLKQSLGPGIVEEFAEAQSDSLSKKLSLWILANNFERVFPQNPDTKTAQSGKRRLQTSVPSPSNDFEKISHNDLSNRFVTFRSIVRSQNKKREQSKRFKVGIRLLRHESSDTLTLSTPCEVFCQCEAMDFWLAYVLHKHHSYLGRPDKLNMEPPKIRNPKEVPTFCKHLFGFMRELIRAKKIRGTK